MLSGVRLRRGRPRATRCTSRSGLYNGDLEEDVQVSYIADDRDTAFNEAKHQAHGRRREHLAGRSARQAARR